MRGLKVTEVREGSVAETAGLLTGDIILLLNEKEVWNKDTFDSAKKGAAIFGFEKIPVTVLRKGERLTKNIDVCESMGIGYVSVDADGVYDANSSDVSDSISVESPKVTQIFYLIALIFAVTTAIGIFVIPTFQAKLFLITAGGFYTAALYAVGLALHYLKGIYINTRANNR